MYNLILYIYLLYKTQRFSSGAVGQSSSSIVIVEDNRTDKVARPSRNERRLFALSASGDRLFSARVIPLSIAFSRPPPTDILLLIGKHKLRLGLGKH